jgi:hypothetical protein
VSLPRIIPVQTIEPQALLELRLRDMLVWAGICAAKQTHVSGFMKLSRGLPV